MPVAIPSICQAARNKLRQQDMSSRRLVLQMFFHSSPSGNSKVWKLICRSGKNIFSRLLLLHVIKILRFIEHCTLHGARPDIYTRLRFLLVGEVLGCIVADEVAGAAHGAFRALLSLRPLLSFGALDTLLALRALQVAVGYPLAVDGIPDVNVVRRRSAHAVHVTGLGIGDSGLEGVQRIKIAQNGEAGTGLTGITLVALFPGGPMGPLMDVNVVSVKAYTQLAVPLRYTLP